MAYALSFTDEFYMLDGDDSLLPNDMEGQEPASVWQALLCLKDDIWDELAWDVFSCDPDHLEISDVIDKIRETDTCSDLSSPVSVWIDEGGYYTVDVFDTQED